MGPSEGNGSIGMAGDGGLSKEEDEMYDRQIRVWGIDTQCAIRSTHVGVVVLGPAKGDAAGGAPKQEVAAAELVKNLALAGVGAISVRFTDFGGEGAAPPNLSFLGQAPDAIKSNLADMNPRMKVAVSSEPEAAASNGDDDVTIVFGRDVGSLGAFLATRAGWAEAKGEGKPRHLFAAGVRGGCGFAFRHSESGGSLSQALSAPKECVPKKVNRLYSVLRCAHAFAREQGRRAEASDVGALVALAGRELALPKQQPSEALLLNYLETEAEMAAVSSIVGGSLAQEVIKAISGKGTLMDNFYLFSAYGSPDSGEAKVERVAAQPPKSKAARRANAANEETICL